MPSKITVDTGLLTQSLCPGVSLEFEHNPEGELLIIQCECYTTSSSITTGTRPLSALANSISVILKVVSRILACAKQIGLATKYLTTRNLEPGRKTISWFCGYLLNRLISRPPPTFPVLYWIIKQIPVDLDKQLAADWNPEEQTVNPGQTRVLPIGKSPEENLTSTHR